MTRIPFILLSATDGSPITGATPTVTISKDGAAFASATNTPAEIGNGYYYIDLTTAETTVTNNVIVRATATGAQPTAVVWEPEQDLSGLSTFDPSTDDVTINATQAATFATEATVANIATVTNTIKSKTDNLPAEPAAVGSEMTLTSATISAVQNGLATSSEISALETHGDSTWATATGFTVPADLANLATVGDISSLASYGDTKWLTATGFATPSDIPSAPDNASAVWSANSRTLTESALTAADVWSYSSRTLTASALTAQDVWEYTARTLTSSPTDISTLATKTDLTTAENAIIQALPDVSGLSTFDPATDKVTLNDTEDGTLSAIKTKVDTLDNTDLTGIATSKNVSDAQTAIIGAIPNDYAKAGDSMTLTAATVNSIKAGLATPETVWAYTSRTLTEEIAVSITTEDINNICAGVWSYVPRRLTSIVSDVIEPNKP